MNEGERCPVKLVIRAFLGQRSSETGALKGKSGELIY